VSRRQGSALEAHRPERRPLGFTDQQVQKTTIASKFLSSFESMSLLGLSSDAKEKPT
jgi:hypothetical protein